jgi:hypothetical protein
MGQAPVRTGNRSLVGQVAMEIFFYIWPFLKNQEMNPAEIYLQDLAPSGWASLVGVTRE